MLCCKHRLQKWIWHLRFLQWSHGLCEGSDIQFRNRVKHCILIVLKYPQNDLEAQVPNTTSYNKIAHQSSKNSWRSLGISCLSFPTEVNHQKKKMSLSKTEGKELYKTLGYSLKVCSWCTLVLGHVFNRHPLQRYFPGTWLWLRDILCL